MFSVVIGSKAAIFEYESEVETADVIVFSSAFFECNWELSQIDLGTVLDTGISAYSSGNCLNRSGPIVHDLRSLMRSRNAGETLYSPISVSRM